MPLRLNYRANPIGQRASGGLPHLQYLYMSGYAVGISRFLSLDIVFPNGTLAPAKGYRWCLYHRSREARPARGTNNTDRGFSFDAKLAQNHLA